MLRLRVEPVTALQQLAFRALSLLTPRAPLWNEDGRMKTVSSLLLVAVLAAATGCAGTQKKGASRVDEFDAIKVDQMTGNNVAPRIMSKTIVCLNARRETRRVTTLTNVTVSTTTNVTITPVTNLTISIATNYQYSLMTNLAALQAPIPAPVPVAPPGDAAVIGASPPSIEVTNAAITNIAPAQLSTNLTISVANNNSGVTAPNQTTANLQSVRTYNNQLTTQSNNLTVSLMTNRVVTAETNQVVTWLTNSQVVSATNTVITPTDVPARDYFLVSELIAPSDFSLAGGESLILLVDGTRYGFTSGQSGTAFVGRRGFTSTLYRVPPEVLVAIANAKEVRVRFKGANSTIERTMSSGSKQNFKDFLLKYFTPETPENQTSSMEKKIASAGQP